MERDMRVPVGKDAPCGDAGRPWRGQSRWRGDETGQATIEYALLVFAFMAAIVGMGALWHAARDGVLLELALGAASHVPGSEGVLGMAEDMALF